MRKEYSEKWSRSSEEIELLVPSFLFLFREIKRSISGVALISLECCGCVPVHRVSMFRVSEAATVDEIEAHSHFHVCCTSMAAVYPKRMV